MRQCRLTVFVNRSACLIELDIKKDAAAMALAFQIAMPAKRASERRGVARRRVIKERLDSLQ
jgi:hypothetical protein